MMDKTSHIECQCDGCEKRAWLDSAMAAFGYRPDILMAKNLRLEKALQVGIKSLELIAAHAEQCIYNHDESFRIGSNAAFEQCADRAHEALSQINQIVGGNDE
jgi:hypothetical protein